MSRNRNKRRAKQITTGSVALLERREPQENVIPISEAKAKGKRTGGAALSKAFSLAWDETEALGITADMRRSGPGMLSDQDRKETLYQAYLNSVWISACVDVIAKRITSGGMVIELTEKGKENRAEYDTLHDFLHYINDDEDFLQLIRSIATDLLIYGEAYLEIVSKAGVPYSLHKIDCSTMNYTLDKHGTVIKYIQSMNHSMDSVIFEPDEVIRFWLPDPKAGKKALSPIERILGSVDADAHMADWVRAFFRKGARPPFWIEFPGSKDEASRFVVWLRENYTGQSNAHVPMVLYDGAKLNEIGKGSVDMDFSKGRGMMRQEILAGYQVPPAIVSQIESGNIGGGTGESQDKSFQFNACDPIRQLIFEKFNFRIVNKGFKILNWRVSTRYADFRSDDAVAALQDKRIRNGSNTVNEVRAEMGKNAVEGGDEAVIVASRDIVPVARLKQLSDEQAQQTDVAIQQAQAQLDMTKVQIDKAKNPPPPPPTIVQAPPPDNKKADEQQERHLLALQMTIAHTNETLARLDEQLRIARDAKVYDEETTGFKETLISELQWMKESEGAFVEELRQEVNTLRSLVEERQETPDTEANAYYGGYKAQETPPFDEQRVFDTVMKRIQQEENYEEIAPETLQAEASDDLSASSGTQGDMGSTTSTLSANGDIHITSDVIQPLPIPGKSTEVQEESAIEDNRPEMLQHHTGMMVAFMLDLENAQKLAIPDGEPASDLHLTLAFLGDRDDPVRQGYLHPVDALEALTFTLSQFAKGSEPIHGKIGGYARFVNPDKDVTPVVAPINAPGLQEWRRSLVINLENAGFYVAQDFDFLPHCTLAYIPDDAPLPIDNVPTLHFTFDTLCLAIGDDRYYFPFGDNNHAEQTTPAESTESDDVTTRTHETESHGTLYPVQESDSVSDSGTANTDVGDAQSESGNTEEASGGSGSVEDEKPKEAPPEQHWQTSDSETLKTLKELEKKGITHLTWKDHPGACENCMKNSGVRVRLGKPFPSGALICPEHNGCWCEMKEEQANGER